MEKGKFTVPAGQAATKELSRSIYEDIGISEKRSHELIKHLNSAFNDDKVISWSTRIEHASNGCESLAELAYCMFQLGIKCNETSDDKSEGVIALRMHDYATPEDAIKAGLAQVPDAHKLSETGLASISESIRQGWLNEHSDTNASITN